LIILAAAAVLALVGWRVYLIAKPSPPERQRRTSAGAPVAVEIAQVTRATLRDAVQLTGSLDSPSRVEIAAKVSGRLERVLVQVGEAVRQGQLLAQLEDQEYRQSLEQAKAEEAVAQANLEAAQIGVQAAQRELERVRSLQDKQIASEAELDSRQTQLAQAQVQVSVAGSQLKQKQVAVEAAQLRLSQTRLAATWNPDGRCAWSASGWPSRGAAANGQSRSFPPGVGPAGGPTAGGRGHIPAPSSRPGRRRERVGIPGRKFAGTLSAVAPFLDRSTGQADAWVQIRNADGALKPGMAVQVELEFGRRVDVPAVPAPPW